MRTIATSKRVHRRHRVYLPCRIREIPSSYMRQSGIWIIGTALAFASIIGAPAAADTYRLYADGVSRENPSAWGNIADAKGDPNCDPPCQCDESIETYAWNGSASTGEGNFACLLPFANGQPIVGWDTTYLTATFGLLALPANQHIKSVQADVLSRYNYNEPPVDPNGQGGRIRIRAQLKNPGAVAEADSPYFQNLDLPNQNPDDDCRYRMQGNGDFTFLSPTGWTPQLIDDSLTIGVRRFEDGPACRSRLRVKAIRLTIDTTVCGDGIVEAPEQCESGVCCDPTTCRYRQPPFVCHSISGDCDVPEICTGTSPDCPADIFRPMDYPCGNPSAVDCDSPDLCNGQGSCVQKYKPATYVCRSAPGDCDVAESCTGTSTVCPANGYRPVDYPCGSQSDVDCDSPDLCNGQGSCVQKYKPTTYVCRPSTGDGYCDPLEKCLGNSATCPGNYLLPPGTACPDEIPANSCTKDVCDAGGMCKHPPIDCAQDDLYCNGPEECVPNGQSYKCMSNGDPCGVEKPVCCESSDSCEAECCSYTECDDSDSCTRDRCDDGRCTHTPDADPCAGPANAKDLVIKHQVRFSALDGGPTDLDGAVDGVLTVRGLQVRNNGSIILDVPTVAFNVCGNVLLREQGSFQPPRLFNGPPRNVKVRAGGSFKMFDRSSIIANGAGAGGTVKVCAEKTVFLCNHATIRAGSVHRDGIGGTVRMESNGPIALADKSAILVDDASGGRIELVSCDDSELWAVQVFGSLWASGTSGHGGTIDLMARQGGISVRNEPFQLRAFGPRGGGAITVHSATTVVPLPLPTDVLPIVYTDDPSSDVCAACCLGSP